MSFGYVYLLVQVLYVSCFLFLTAELVGYVTLRLLKPLCCIEPGWREEDLLLATKRVISIIHSQTVPVNVFGTTSSESLTELMSAPAFAFCFPLLRCVLREGGKAVQGDEDLRQEVLQVVAEHCKLRAGDDQDEEEEQKEVNELRHVEIKSLFVCFTHWTFCVQRHVMIWYRIPFTSSLKLT